MSQSERSSSVKSKTNDSNNNNNNNNDLTNLDSHVETVNSILNTVTGNNNENHPTILGNKRNSEQIQLLNVNVVNEASNAKSISASSCSIATSSGTNKKFRLKSIATSGNNGSGGSGGGVGGGLLASIKNTTLTASKIISRATSTSRSSSPTNVNNKNVESTLSPPDLNVNKKTYKLKSFKHSAIESELDSGENNNGKENNKFRLINDNDEEENENDENYDDDENDDDDDDIKNSKLNLNYTSLLKQNTSSYKEMVSNINKTIDILTHNNTIQNQLNALSSNDHDRPQVAVNSNKTNFNNNNLFEDVESDATNQECAESVKGDLDETYFFTDNKSKQYAKPISKQVSQNLNNDLLDYSNKLKSKNRANSFNTTTKISNNLNNLDNQKVPLITTENMSINTDDEYTTTSPLNKTRSVHQNQPTKTILTNSNRNINSMILPTPLNNVRQSTVSFSDATNDDKIKNKIIAKSNETLTDELIDKNQRISEQQQKLHFIDSLPSTPKNFSKNENTIVLPDQNNNNLSNLLVTDLNASTTTNKTFISSTSISTLNQTSRSTSAATTTKYPANFKLIKPMTTGSKAMRIMGNNSAFMGNGPLKNQISAGGSSNKSSGSLTNKSGKKALTQKRLFFKNGNINISRSNIDKRRRRYLTDIFTTLIDLKWRYNVLVFSLGFLISWISFAIAWYFISYIHGDLSHINDPNYVACISGIHGFIGAILFSIETQQTIGYGARYTTEKCPEAILFMMIQSCVGVMIQSFMVGVVFAKLSRPKKRSETLMFSKNAVISLRDGRLCLICRVGDMRKSHIVEAHVRMYLIKKKVTMEGEILPLHMYDLNVGWDKGLDRLFLVWPLTIEHYIDQNSPFWTISADDLKKERFELAVILEGIVESTGMTTQARSSYLVNEILWGHRFEKLITFQKEDGTYKIDYSRFNMTVPIDTPTCSAKDLEELKEQEAFIVDALQESTPTTINSNTADMFNERKRNQKAGENESEENTDENNKSKDDSLKTNIKMIIEDHSNNHENDNNNNSRAIDGNQPTMISNVSNNSINTITIV